MRHRVEENRQIMSEAAHENKDVPEGMVITAIVAIIEINAKCVEDASGKNPQNSSERNGMDHGNDGQNAQPAHEQIDGQRDSRMPVAGDAFINQTGYGANPDGENQRPSYPSIQAKKREGCIGSRDQQING